MTACESESEMRVRWYSMHRQQFSVMTALTPGLMTGLNTYKTYQLTTDTIQQIVAEDYDVPSQSDQGVLKFCFLQQITAEDDDAHSQIIHMPGKLAGREPDS